MRRGGWSTHRFGNALFLRPPIDHGVQHVLPDADEDGKRDDEQHVEVELIGLRRRGHPARRHVGSDKKPVQQVADNRYDDPDDRYTLEVIRVVLRWVLRDHDYDTTSRMPPM